MATPTAPQRMELVIRKYVQACNDADATAIAACFGAEAVFYFPGRAKWSGAATIGANFARVVEEQGVRWTVDQLLTDIDRHAAAIEWTRFRRESDQVVRGVEWFVFDPQLSSIQEVRPYYASPVHPEAARQELQDFDYLGRGYPTTPS